MRLKTKSLQLFLPMMMIWLLPVHIRSQSINTPIKLAQDVVPPETVERLKAIFERNEYAVKTFRGDWLPDGSGYLVLESSPQTRAQALVLYDPASGTRTELVSASQLSDPEIEGSSIIESYISSPDGGQLLLAARSRSDRSRALSYWMLDRKTGKIRKVKAGADSRISPDGQKILFSEGGNLHVYDIPTGGITPLTLDAIPGSVSYQQGSWSPDGQWIVFVQSDVSRIRFRSMLLPTDPTFPEVTETRFARVGETIASLRIGVVDVKGKEMRWIPIPLPAEGFYLGQVDWAGNPDEVLIEQLSRFRDQRDVYLANIHTGLMTRIFHESDPAWVVASYGTNLGVEWMDGYGKFLILSEKDGWRHAYVCSRDGKEQKIITPGEYDIIERVGVDRAGGWFYYYASPENGTQSYLYRVRLDGKGKQERVTPENQPGTHRYVFSPDFKWAFHTYSSANKPPVTGLVGFPKHQVVKMLEDNQSLHGKAASLEPVEFFQVDIGNGINIDGWMIKPKDFDPSRKYPVFIYVYGEPHSQTVKDSWGFAMADYHRAIANLGYIVISMDNRGTPCPKGAAWRRAIAGSLGPLSTEEQSAALKEFGRTRPYADLSRVGIWGWSGGGSNTLNALFRKPDLYRLGIAVVPKPQPHLYNAWFQEIYMKTPEVNPQGYKESAPIHFAEGLQGNLLIVTGTGETNTHVQIVEGLVDRLVELGKQFDYMAYPNRNHGLSEGAGTSLHLRIYMARYLLSHLPAGPK